MLFRSLRRHAAQLPGVQLHYGHRLIGYRADEDGIVAEVERLGDRARFEICASFVVGADGPRSTVRQSLGISYGGTTGV